MFEIEYKGGNTLVVSSKKTTLVVDPRRSLVGQNDLAVGGAIELATEPRFALNSQGAKLCIEGPGEYEIGDMAIRGVRAWRHLDAESEEPIDTIYRIEIGGVRIAVIGNIMPKVSEEQLEAVGIVDIVVIPVGGNGYTLDAESAAAIVRQIDPRAAIPVHYADTSLQYEVTQDEVDRFIKELAAPVEEVGTKYKLKSAAALPATLTTVIVGRS